MTEEPTHESDAGSITPLAIGFVVIALLLAFLIAALTDLHMARRQSGTRRLRGPGGFGLLRTRPR